MSSRNIQMSETSNIIPSDNGKYIAIGDLHGCARSLEALLKKLADISDRTHVFVGDYIDRGPDSKGVVTQVLDYSKSHHCVFLQGNHEKMLMDAINSGDMHHWLMNGGYQTLESYGVSSAYDIPREHLHFFSSTQLWFNTPDYLFIHAGLNPGLTIEEQLSKPDIDFSALWERSHVYSPVAWEKTVVFGHTPVAEPIIEEKKIAIDTGCVFFDKGYGTLSALLLPEKKIISQDYTG